MHVKAKMKFFLCVAKYINKTEGPYSALWESFAYHPTILTSWLYYFLTDYLNGNELTCKTVSFYPLITQKYAMVLKLVV